MLMGDVEVADNLFVCLVKVLIILVLGMATRNFGNWAKGVVVRNIKLFRISRGVRLICNYLSWRERISGNDVLDVELLFKERAAVFIWLVRAEQDFVTIAV